MTSVNAELYHREYDKRNEAHDAATPRTIVQTIEWFDVRDVKPDAEQTVLLALRDGGEPVWPGWYDGESMWFDASGAVLPKSWVTHWAPMPEAPCSSGISDP